MLASAARNLAAPPVDGRALHLTVVAVAEPTRGLLYVRAGALQVPAVEDDSALLARVYHLVHVGERRADGLVRRDATNARLGRGDHRVLDELPRQNDHREIGRLVHLPVHLLGVLEQRRDAETLPHDGPPVVVELRDGDHLGILERVVHLRIVLAHTAATNNRHSQLFVGHVSLRPGHAPGTV